MQGYIKPKYKKRLIHRLKIIQGQLRGLEKSVENDDYCIQMLNQSLAIQESLKSFDVLILENHLRTHIISQFKGKDTEKAIQELLKAFKYSKR